MQGCAMSPMSAASGGRQLLLPSAAVAVTVPSCAPMPPSSPVPPPPPGFLRASSPMTLKQQPPAVLTPSLSLLPDRAATAVEVGAAPLQRRSVPDIHVPSSGGGGGCASLQLFPQMKRNSYQGDHRMVSMNGSLC